jgi:hypothetical protein
MRWFAEVILVLAVNREKFHAVDFVVLETR